MDKIASLGGTHRAEILKSNMVCFNTRKHSNEHIYYNVDTLEHAIQNNKKVIFYYYNLDENGNRVYRRNHHHYVVEPVALVFNEDNYYLISYSARHDGTANYRVDRMEAVEIIEEDICEKAISLRNRVSEYTEQAFKMYGGEAVEVVLEFHDALIGAIWPGSEDGAYWRTYRHLCCQGSNQSAILGLVISVFRCNDDQISR